MKKIISILMCIVLLGTSFTVMAKGNTSIEPKQKAFLQALDIIPSVSDEDDAYVTREMQAVTLMKLLNINSVDTAVEMGLIDTLDNGQSDLTQYVRFSEVARGLLTALGYKPVVELNGGSYSKYIELAQSLKISTKLGLSNDDYVNEKEFAIMVYRLLDTPMVTFDPSTKTIDVGDDDYTILAEYHDIYTDKGIVTSNEVTNLSGASNLAEGNIIIDGNIELQSGNTNAKHLLGYKVEYAYFNDKETGDKTLLWIYADEEENHELYLQKNQIDDYNALVYTYDDGKNNKRAVLDNAVSIIYNGVATAASSLTKEQMIPAVGEITLLNTNNDTKYDVVIIMDYTVCVISTADADKESVSFSDEDVNSLDLTNFKDYDIFDKEYNQKQLGDLKSKTVVWLAKSLNGAYVQLLISTETIKGSVSAKRVEDGEVILKIDDTEYPVRAVKSTDSLSIGAYGTFSLAIDGSIADWVTNIGKDKKFVYMVKAFEDDNATVSVRIFDGEMKVLKCADNLRINGERYKTTTAVLEELDNYKDGIAIVEISDDEVVKKIDTPQAQNEENGRPYIVGQVPKSGEGEGTLFIKRHGNLLCNYFGLADDCVVFQVPGNRSEYSKYKMGGPELLGTATTVYGVTGYKTSDEQGRCVAAVYDRTINLGSNSSSSRTTVAVTDVEIGLDSNDEVVYGVTGKAMYSNSDVSFTVKDEELLAKIKKGNVIRYDTDESNVAVAVTVDYDYEKDSTSITSGGAYGDNYRIGQGKIIQKWDDGVLLNTAGIYSYIKNQWIPLGYCNTWTWEKTRKGMELKQIAAGDIKVGDKMIYWQGYGGIDNILIIKND